MGQSDGRPAEMPCRQGGPDSGGGVAARHVLALKEFLFERGASTGTCAVVSGGEKARYCWLKIWRFQATCLVLD